ncbi:hypothetical protein BDF20DRAFT_838810 [Mycotypha africana]|uniref:uncharacterized protein n=1 Tax=Mycotypha africana TaxID=64632 RepID=UPI0023019620|nr:uncharacterized protein BDF20DRAFT_838810 [Mycotypha africana]KAI8970453.1 hypothetical protein BDF20DRAFT_838810 [Mycotypha africana]
MSSSRSVSYNTPNVGLNERFSRIVRSSANTRSNGTATAAASQSSEPSVFGRLRGPNNNQSNARGSGNRTAANIQNRLGRVNGGLKKKPATSSNTKGGVGRNNRGGDGRIQKRQRQQPQQQQRGDIKNKGKGKGKASTTQKNKQQQKSKKPLTAEQLDKALDSYMMKDSTYAQAKLDAELDSYMDEASDILIEGGEEEEGQKL